MITCPKCKSKNVEVLNAIGTIIYPPRIKNTEVNKIDSIFIPLSEDYELRVYGIPENLPKRWVRPEVGKSFVKVGRTTGRTVGVISHINALAKVNYGGELGVCEFRPCIFALQNNYNIVAGGDSVAWDTRLYWKENEKLKFGTIEELFNNFDRNKKIEVLSVRKNNDKYPSINVAEVGWNGVKDVLFHGEKDVFEVMLNNGKKIKITEDHSLFSMVGSFTSSIEPKTLRDAKNFISVVKEINVNKKSKGKIVELLGLYTADGCCIKDKGKKFKNNKRSIVKRKYKEGEIRKNLRGIYISTGNDKKIVEFIKQFGNPKHKAKGDYRIHSASLARELERIGLDRNATSYSKRVPTWLFTASDDDVYGFLRGYFSGDGSIHQKNKHARIDCGSVNRKLLEDIQLLLDRIGIRSNIDVGYISTGNFKSKNRQYKLGIEWTKSVNLFMEKIGFLNKGYEFKELEFRKERPLASKKIRRIKYMGKEKIYDLKVSPSESFVANGVLCHNSGSCIFNDEGVIGQTFAAGPNLAIFLTGEVVAEELGIGLEKKEPLIGYVAIEKSWFTNKEVLVNGLRLRSSPEIANNIIKNLAAGTKIEPMEYGGFKSGWHWLKIKVAAQ